MLERGKMERGIYEIVDTESLVPAEHLLRKIDAAINWNKLYDMVEPLYCEDNGRPSIDPVVLFKMVLIQHLYGLPSLRRAAEEVRANIYYRWFLGYRCIICPEYQVLKYSTTNRDGYREYKSNPQTCANCPTRALCTRNKDFIKTVTQHIWKPYVDMAEELRYTDRHKRYYKMRKETIERVFADAKEKHGMRYTRYTGLAQVTNWVKLKFAAMNLKKFAIKKWEDTHNLLQILIFWTQYAQNPSFA